jgi:hypothetical protein
VRFQEIVSSCTNAFRITFGQVNQTGSFPLSQIAQRLFDETPDVRYVALSTDGEPELHQRPDLRTPSAAHTDRFEELVVNPTLLTLAAARGDIDCGGLDYVVVRYGHFFQLVLPIAAGHISVAIEPDGDVFGVLARVRRLLREEGLQSSERS